MTTVLNIAHRGYSKAYTENTREAFEKAVEAGADGFECDLRLSRDGEVLLFHDDTLDRLCGRSGRLEDLTSEEIAQITSRGQKIPTLAEAVEGFEHFIWNLELKPTEKPEPLVRAVLKALQSGLLSRKPLVSSFDPDVLKTWRALDPAGEWAQIGILVETQYLHLLDQATRELKPDTWNLPKSILNSSPLEVSESRAIWIWTLDLESEWKAAIDRGVAAIITNDPKALDQYLSR